MNHLDADSPAGAPTLVDADRLRRRVSYRAAADALRDALARGFDPATDLQRRQEPLTHGAMLLMPSQGQRHAGIKVLTMAPDNPARGLDLIQGTYLLFDGTTLGLTHIIDGPALTDLRTPAMSMAALAPALSRFDRPVRVVVFGAGHQGRSHAQALHEIDAGGVGVESITAVVRHPESVAAADVFTDVVRSGSAEVEAALRVADVVICATPARDPLFDSALLRDEVVVAAVGSHSPEARELDAALMARGEVVVEDRATALRECGDVVLAVAEGALAVDDLVPVADVVTRRHAIDPGRPYIFKGSGMPWQDLVVAGAYADSVG